MPRRAPTHRPPVLKATPHRPPRASSAQRGYGRAWQRLRDVYLCQYPLCADPFDHHAEAGVFVAAEHVDHVVPLASGGGSEFTNLQGLCGTCHRRKTVLHDGGLGRARKEMIP